MAELPEGLTILYQDKVCGTVFEFTRPVGVEPGHGSIFMGIEEFTEYKVDEGLLGVDLAPVGAENVPPEPQTPSEDHLSTRDADRQDMSLDKGGKNSLQFGEAVRGWQSCGDLVFAEVVVTDGKREEHVVRIQKVCLTERAVESPFAFDDGSDLCKIEITDIRELWKTRGIVTAWVNVPAIAPGSPVEGSGAQGPTGPGTQELKSTGGKIGTFIPGSTNGGAPWTLRQTLERFVFPNLPGNPRLNRLPRELESATPIGHVWNAVLAKQALVDLLDEYELTLALDLDSNVSLWIKGEGPSETGLESVLLASASGNSISAKSVPVNPLSAACDPRVGTTLKSMAYYWPPSTVVVVGPPVIVTERLWLEAVGEVDGIVMPFERALAAIGLNLDQAKIMALTRSTDRALFFGATEDGLKEFERWAFKMFRVPGGAEQNADKLPLLDGRGTKSPSGQINPMRVSSETHSIVNVQDIEIAMLFAKRNAELLAEALKLRKQEFAKRVGTTTQEVLELSIDGKNASFKKSVTFRSDLAGKRFDQSGEAGADRAVSAKTAAEQVAAQLKKANPGHYLIAVNHGLQPQSSGFTVDLHRGIVHFREIQGSVFKDGAALDTDGAFLAGIPAVQLEFAHTLKPSLDSPMRLGHRYNSVWIRQKDGKVVQIAAIPDGSAPVKIERLELQQINGLDGTTNKSVLDKCAASIAAKRLTAPKFMAGFNCTFVRPVPVINTGQATSIRWFTDQERPRVEVRHGSMHPLAAMPDLRTRAFGVGAGRLGSAIESEIVPRGLTG